METHKTLSLLINIRFSDHLVEGRKFKEIFLNDIGFSFIYSDITIFGQIYNSTSSCNMI